MDWASELFSHWEMEPAMFRSAMRVAQSIMRPANVSRTYPARGCGMMNEPPGDGWLLWADPQGLERIPGLLAMGNCIEIWRAEWGNRTEFLTWRDVGPGVNVSGLWWRRA
jgi:hypothetical protein